LNICGHLTRVFFKSNITDIKHISHVGTVGSHFTVELGSDINIYPTFRDLFWLVYQHRYHTIEHFHSTTPTNHFYTVVLTFLNEDLTAVVYRYLNRAIVFSDTHTYKTWGHAVGYNTHNRNFNITAVCTDSTSKQNYFHLHNNMDQMTKRTMQMICDFHLVTIIVNTME
jgi:hypothetical protein